MNNLIAITIGDSNGIGIYILIDAWKQKKVKKEDYISKRLENIKNNCCIYVGGCFTTLKQLGQLLLPQML